MRTREVMAVLRDLNPGKTYKTMRYNGWGATRQIVEADGKGGWLHVAPINSNGIVDVRLLPDVTDYISSHY